MWVAMCLCTAQVKDVGSFVFVCSPCSRYGKLCVCVLLSFKMWVAMCLCTAQVQDMGSYVFVYCPGQGVGCCVFVYCSGQGVGSNVLCTAQVQDVCLFCCFTSQVNSYGHCRTVSSPNHTYYLGRLEQAVNQ